MIFPEGSEEEIQTIVNYLYKGVKGLVSQELAEVINYLYKGVKGLVSLELAQVINYLYKGSRDWYFWPSVVNTTVSTRCKVIAFYKVQSTIYTKYIFIHYLLNCILLFFILGPGFG